MVVAEVMHVCAQLAHCCCSFSCSVCKFFMCTASAGFVKVFLCVCSVVPAQWSELWATSDRANWEHRLYSCPSAFSADQVCPNGGGCTHHRVFFFFFLQWNLATAFLADVAWKESRATHQAQSRCSFRVSHPRLFRNTLITKTHACFPNGMSRWVFIFCNRSAEQTTRNTTRYVIGTVQA